MSILNDDRPEWFDDAACTAYAEKFGGPARDLIFFPTQGETSTKARQMCAECPVNQQCLEYAITERIGYGVWGGLSARERRRIRRERGDMLYQRTPPRSNTEPTTAITHTCDGVRILVDSAGRPTPSTNSTGDHHGRQHHDR